MTSKDVQCTLFSVTLYPTAFFGAKHGSSMVVVVVVVVVLVVVVVGRQPSILYGNP